MSSLLLDPLPVGMFPPAEEAMIVFARKSALMEPIDNVTYTNLLEHYSVEQAFEICFVVGLHQMVTRMHALFMTDVDEETIGRVGGSCPVRMPKPPDLEG